MNEITKIHLGRQPFTIAVDAHLSLQTYLAAIKRQVGDKAKDIVDEVELRMAELLTERGIDDDQVVLVADIDFLKQQLGKPGDFKEDTESSEVSDKYDDASEPKRLFRDSKHGMVAGVAAGLSVYSKIPVIFIRLIFIALTFSGGVGILIYFLLWLLMPATKSPSDYLQMKGQAVTIENIKLVVERADFQGAAERAGQFVNSVWIRGIRLISTTLGLGFILLAISVLAAAATSASYLLVHGLQLVGNTIFPVGTKEVSIVICGLLGLVVIAVMLAISGRAILIHKWTFPAWALAIVITSFVATTSIGMALGFATGPAIAQRGNALQHNETRQLPDFQFTDIKGGHPAVGFTSSTHYSIDIHTLGKINPKDITTEVVNGHLTIDMSHVPVQQKACSVICLFGHRDNIELLVHQPAPLGRSDDMEVPDTGKQFPSVYYGD